MAHVLIVDDHVDSAATLRELIAGPGFTVATARNLHEGRKQITLQQPDLVLLDVKLPDGNGMDLLADTEFVANSEVILMTGDVSLETSIQALRMGAADCMVKPIDPGQLQGVLSRLTKPSALPLEVTDLSAGVERSGHFGSLWGRSPPMQRVYDQIARVAATGITVFISGESGSGKELVAQAVHDSSRRRRKPFLAVNCGAISPQLIESEIFGHEKGSFTGADRMHQGFFERANGGTLFLDEITEMSLELQVKLLRVLESGHFMRVGSTHGQQVDVRVIAATNRPPEHAVASGKLREDLFYRLNVFPIALPPLRERLSDVPLLAEHFLAQTADTEGKVKRFSAPALAQLSRYSWPGNVRELRNAVQRSYVMAPGDVIGDEYLPQNAPGTAAHAAVTRPLPAAHAGEEECVTVTLGSSMAQAERETILATLRHCRFHKEKAAAVLGISLKTLYNRLKSYSVGGIEPPEA